LYLEYKSSVTHFVLYLEHNLLLHTLYCTWNTIFCYTLCIVLGINLLLRTLYCTWNTNFLLHTLYCTWNTIFCYTLCIVLGIQSSVTHFVLYLEYSLLLHTLYCTWSKNLLLHTLYCTWNTIFCYILCIVLGIQSSVTHFVLYLEYKSSVTYFVLYLEYKSSVTYFVLYLDYVSPLVCSRPQFDAIYSYFDLNSFFELVPHTLLLNILSACGLFGGYVIRFHSYVSSRYSVVRFHSIIWYSLKCFII